MLRGLLTCLWKTTCNSCVESLGNLKRRVRDADGIQLFYDVSAVEGRMSGEREQIRCFDAGILWHSCRFFGFFTLWMEYLERYILWL